jgi:hypothetical protein
MPRWRTLLGAVLLVVAGVLVPVSLIATWTARTVTDTDAFVERVAPVAAQPAVQKVVEQQISDTVDTVVIQGMVGTRVGSAIDELDAPDLVKVLLRNLATSAGGWAQERVARVSHKVVTAPQFQSAFREALRAAHGELVGTLEGDTDQVVVADDRTVSIKVATIGNAIRDELVAAGFEAVDRVPELQATIPIATVDQLDKWRTSYRLLKVLVWLGPLLVVLLVGLGLWLLRDLGAGGLWFTAAAVTGILAVTWAARHGVDAAVGGIPDPDRAAAARSVVETLTGSLLTNSRVTRVVLVLLFVGSLVLVLRPTLAGTDWSRARRPFRVRSEA